MRGPKDRSHWGDKAFDMMREGRATGERQESLVAVNAILARRLDAALAVLREVEWIRTDNETAEYDECPSCRAIRGYGHAPDCKLAAVLKEKP